MVTSFRLIALLTGLALVALIFIDGIRRLKRQQSQHPEIRHAPNTPSSVADPLFHRDDFSDVIITAPQRDHATSLEQSELKQHDTITLNGAPELIVLYALADHPSTYHGSDVVSSLQNNGLRYGAMSIYHYPRVDKAGDSVFSIALACEPGAFDLSMITSLETPGLCLFFATKNRIRPLHDFDTMLSVAEQLVDRLGGQLYTSDKEPLDAHHLAVIRQSLAVPLELNVDDQDRQ